MEDEAIASQSVVLRERSRIVQWLPSLICTNWISCSDSRFIQICAAIKIQLDTHSFNWGELTDVCSLFRRAYSENTLSDDVVQALVIIGFVWSPKGAILS